jgi:hypothetical protein
LLNPERIRATKINRTIHVSGVLPGGNRLDPEVRRVLREKLPKLAAADADQRLLMIDQTTFYDSENSVLEVIRRISVDFPLLHEIQAIVFAKTWPLVKKVAYFSIWDVRTGQWSEHLKASIVE